MTATAERPVRVHLAMEDGPLPRSIQQVLPIVGNEKSHVYVETQGEADLIIFTEPREIERGYTKEKSYAYFLVPWGMNKAQLPDNCMTIDSLNIMQGLMDAINGARKNLKPIAEASVVEETETIPLRRDAKRILVIEDTPMHQASARKLLAGHKLTVATGYEEAMELLGKEEFDVVMTDLHLPMSSKTMGNKFRLGELVPYGILLMIEAAVQGAKHIAVVTDLSHHDDPFSAAFDHFSTYSVLISAGTWVRMMHSPMTVDGCKDWAKALDMLLNGKF